MLNYDPHYLEYLDVMLELRFKTNFSRCSQSKAGNNFIGKNGEEKCVCGPPR